MFSSSSQNNWRELASDSLDLWHRSMRHVNVENKLALPQVLADRLLYELTGDA